MEENLKLIPQSMDGIIVRIKPNTRFWTDNPANPKNIPGIIVNYKYGEWINVNWENGNHNTYQEHDLDFESIPDSIETNINKIYFSDPNIEINNMTKLLSTLYPENKSGSAVETYFKNNNTGELFEQCSVNKMRSFDDIWILADTYMPGIDVKDVFKELLLHKVTLDAIKRNVIFKSFSNCGTMARIRYTNSYSSLDSVMSRVDCIKYDSIYSWRDLFNMIEVKDSKELKEWYINELKVAV